MVPNIGISLNYGQYDGMGNKTTSEEEIFLWDALTAKNGIYSAYRVYTKLGY